MNEIYSNADTAARLGIAVNSLNKKRNRWTSEGRLTEGPDWRQDASGVWWTASGLAVLEGAASPSESDIVCHSASDIARPSDGDMSCPSIGDIPSPAAIAAAHAPAVVSRYLAAVDDAMASEVTRLLREGDSLKKHLASRWGIEAGAVS